MAKVRGKEEPSEQQQKTLVFDAEIPVSPLLEKRAVVAEEMRERRRGKEMWKKRERERKRDTHREGKERYLGIYAEATA